MRVLYPVIGGSGVEIYSERLVAGLDAIGLEGTVAAILSGVGIFSVGSEMGVELGSPRDKGLRPRSRQRRLWMLLFSCRQATGSDAAPQFD